MMKTIRQLLLQYKCKEIVNCPSRFIVKQVPESLTVIELLGEDVEITICDSPKAKDKIAIVILKDGGIISYIRSDGTLLHTINTTSGFSRKIHDLELSQILSDDQFK